MQEELQLRNRWSRWFLFCFFPPLIRSKSTRHGAKYDLNQSLFSVSFFMFFLFFACACIVLCVLCYLFNVCIIQSCVCIKTVEVISCCIVGSKRNETGTNKQGKHKQKKKRQCETKQSEIRFKTTDRRCVGYVFDIWVLFVVDLLVVLVVHIFQLQKNEESICIVT